MTKINELSVLQQYLTGNFKTELEQKLNLKPTKGIPNCNFRYEKDMWDSENAFWDFLSYARTAPTLSGQVNTFGNPLDYYIVLVELEGIYYIQVEIEDSHGDIVARVYSSDKYKKCLEFALNLIGIKE